MRPPALASHNILEPIPIDVGKRQRVQLAEHDAIRIVDRLVPKNIVPDKPALAAVTFLLGKPRQPVTVSIQRRDDVVESVIVDVTSVSGGVVDAVT